MTDKIPASAADAASDDSRQALLRCGLEHLQRAGHESISVRSLAACAGLSAGAPYYHFGTRRGLLAALALDGFRQLNRQAADLVQRRQAEPRQALVDLAQGFIAFNLESPHLFDLMYESELTHPVDPLLNPAYHEAFDIVVGAISAARGASSPAQNIIRAVSFWTSLFGLARLLRLQLLDPFFEGAALNLRDLMVEEAVAGALRNSPD